MTMRKPYDTPQLVAQPMTLGVFGDYGSGEGGGDNNDPIVRIVDRFTMRME
jgi:hypothetical protein